MSKILAKVSQLELHYRLVISIVFSVIVFMLTWKHLKLPMLIVTTWTVYALCFIILSWVSIFIAHPKKIRSIARLEDSSYSVIFLIVLIAACLSIFAIIMSLKSAESNRELFVHIALTVTSVVSSWLLVHTLFALRYAHLYFGDAEDKKQIVKGLDFPKEDNPDYLDFAYFSFVIGMTCQVSDVQITDRTIRRLALVHGVISFGFNTIIMALTINVISGLLEK